MPGVVQIMLAMCEQPLSEHQPTGKPQAASVEATLNWAGEHDGVLAVKT